MFNKSYTNASYKSMMLFNSGGNLTPLKPYKEHSLPVLLRALVLSPPSNFQLLSTYVPFSLALYFLVLEKKLWYTYENLFKGCIVFRNDNAHLNVEVK